LDNVSRLHVSVRIMYFFLETNSNPSIILESDYMFIIRFWKYVVNPCNFVTITCISSSVNYLFLVINYKAEYMYINK